MKKGEIRFKKIKELPFYAASGLAKYKENFFVVADDERSLYKFNIHKDSFEETSLQAGTLPTEYKERKRLKPDWEALAYFPSLEGILAVPSGSKPNRQTGYFMKLGEAQAKPIEVDFSKIYNKLQENFDELNIEGAVVMNSTFKLLQRGNGKSNQNAIITFDLAATLQDIKSSRCLAAQNILDINFFDLGKIGDSPLSFTDGFSINNSLYFLAVCEETISTYEDGPFKGAILGQINEEEKITATWMLDCPFKPEGLWMEKADDRFQIYLVTDADSREQASSLYLGELS